MSRRSWSLRRRLAATVAVIGLVLLVVVGNSVWLLHDVRSRQDRVVVGYFNALTLSEQQFTWLVDAETAVRGYALTHDSVTLEPLSEADGSPAVTRRIRAALAGDRSTLAALDRAQVSAARWYTQWAQPSVAALQHGSDLSTQDVLAGKALFDRLRADFHAYLSTLDAQRDAARHRLAVSTNLLFTAVIASAVVAGLTVAALWFLLRRWVITPVAALAAETRGAGAGDLDEPVTGSGPLELLALAGDVDMMRRRLAGQLAQARASAVELQAARALAERSSEELERSNRDLEQFAYVASHDLQEPLRKVASFCQLLQKRYGGQLDDRADQYIGFAVDGAKRMQQLINDLLAFSRVGRGASLQDGTPAATADLAVALERALAALSVAVEESGAVVTADRLPVVPGQLGLLTQLFQNLVGNAIKFRAPDRAPRVEISARRAEHEGEDVWQFACTDNGIGIEPQYAERVFVIFQRLHAKEVYSGTGIGLAMCKRIIEFHGGQIWVDPAAETGTTVRWTLPADGDRSAATLLAERSTDGGG